MDFTVPDNDLSVLLHSRRVNRDVRPFSLVPYGFLAWLCRLIEKRYCITHNSQRAKVDELGEALRHALAGSLNDPLLTPRPDEEELRHYVTIVGLSDLLPHDCAALQQIRAETDWTNAFRGYAGYHLLHRLVRNGQTQMLMTAGYEIVYRAAAERIRALEREERLQLYCGYGESFALWWIPQLEGFDDVSEGEAAYLLLALIVHAELPQCVFTSTAPTSSALVNVSSDATASALAILLAAKLRPETRGRLSLIDTTPDFLFELAVLTYNTAQHGTSDGLVRELRIDDSLLKRITSRPEVQSALTSLADAGVSETVASWLSEKLQTVEPEDATFWLLKDRSQLLNSRILPPALVAVFTKTMRSNRIRGLLSDTVRSALEAADAGTPLHYMTDELLETIGLAILEEPEAELLPLLCLTISSGRLQQDLMGGDNDLFDQFRSRAKIDPFFRERVKSLGVEKWPDQNDKWYWQDVVEKYVLSQTSEYATERHETESPPEAIASLDSYLAERPESPAIAVGRWFTAAGSDTAEYRAPSLDEAFRELHSRVDQKHIQLCILAALVARGWDDASHAPQLYDDLAAYGRQQLNELRLAVRDDRSDIGLLLDIGGSSLLVSGRYGNWWKSVKHVIQSLRHSRHVTIGPDLAPQKSEAPDYSYIPRAFEFAVFRVMTEEEHRELRREMAKGLADYLRPRRQRRKGRSTQVETSGAASGYAPHLTEPDPLWRRAYLYALRDLGVKQSGTGHTFHSLLSRVAESDPSEEVRKLAGEVDRTLNRQRTGWTRGSPKRLLSHAWWWIKQAHRLSLGEDIDKEAAQRTRVSEFR